MAFNWFRRQFSASEKSSETRSDTPQEQEQLTPASVEPEAEPNEEVAPSEEPPQNVAAESLMWAKAAYKNIKQQQGSQLRAEVPSVEQTGVEQGELLNREESVATEPIADKPPGAVTNEQTSGTTPERSDEPVGTGTTEQPVGTADEATAPAAKDPLPFWAIAASDRQARLERLKATAIEVPEPEVVQQATAKPEPVGANLAEASTETPSIAFDEGFLWSAEVLSAQGRRPEDVSIEEITWLKKLRQGLDKTRRNIVNQLKAIVGQGPLNQAAVLEIEALLLQADVGVEATDYIINALQDRLKKEALPPDAAIAYLKQLLRDMLDRPLESHKPIFVPEKDTLNIWLITGVNGAGKTTTIGKIAHIAQKSGYKCLIAAADTFRAAAVEQVKIWGSRSGIEVIANPGQNTDPAAVVFDAISAAQSQGTELLLVDTAGRLQNKKNLMDELSKIRRIIDKKAVDATVESLLVLDATLGQNGLRQAEVFAQAANLSGVVLTKLDGTAKGGVALAVVQQMGLPIRFIGAGEGIEDLRPFSSYEFVEALLSS